MTVDKNTNSSIGGSQSSPSSSARTFAVLAILMVVALVVLWPTLRMGIWLDEYLSINSSTGENIIAVVTNGFGRQDDYHPPLFYMVLNVWMKLFGGGDLSVKIPSVIFGLFTIPVAYCLGRVCHSNRIGLLTALFCAISPLAQFLSGQCRGYALAGLLSAIALTAYIVLVRTGSGNSVSKSASVSAFLVSAIAIAALCYTAYVGCVLIPCLGLASTIILVRHYAMTNDAKLRKQSLQTYGKCVASLILAFLLFSPWLPSVMNQTSGALYLDRTPFSRFPEVFFWNWMNMLPAHIFFGPALLAILVLVFIIRTMQRKRGGAETLAGSDDSSAGENSFGLDRDVAIILLTVTIIPCCLMGYITTWWVGYFRYVYPFCPAAWVLLATFVSLTFWNRDGSIGKSSKMALAAILVILSAINISWSIFRTQIPNSGLNTVAQEALKGQFDNTAFVICPDAIGPTLGYYLPEDARKAHHVGLFGFAKWDDTVIPANIPDMSKPWMTDTLIEDTLKRIDQLAAAGYKYVALTRDSDKQLELLSSAKMPRKKRVDELLAALNHKYKVISTKQYPAVTEDVTITRYELPQQ